MVRLRIKELAEERKMNISSLSRKSDVALRTVRRLWKEPTHPANTATLEKLAKALGVSIKDLFGEEP